jgi:archaellin
MLMQPQNPDPKFDFMLKDQPPARRSLMPNLPKPAMIALIVIAAIILLIVISSLLSNRGKSSTQPFINAAARAQETLRVTALAKQQLHDSQTQALAATVNAALGSDEQQIINYLANSHITASKTQLAAVLDRTADTSLQTAAQNNNLDSAYVTYLQAALTKYESDLENATKSAGPNGRKVLLSASQSTHTLLNSPPLKA